MSLVVAKVPRKFFRALLQVTRDETSSRHEIILVLKSEVMQTSLFLGGNKAQEIQCNVKTQAF